MGNKPIYHLHKKHIVLLEVLISFALVTLCALPLIYPHVMIFKAEKASMTTVELDHAINLLYANRLEKLYLHEIPWSDIQNHQEISIDDDILQLSGIKQPFPFKASYQFIEGKHKPKDRIEDTVHLVKMVFKFIPKDAKQKTLEYPYPIVIEYRPK